MSKTFPLRGIRGRLFLLLLIVIIPVLVIEAFIYHKRFEARKSEELQANLEVARAVAKNFETFVLDIVHSQLVIGLAFTPSQPLTAQDQNRILDRFQRDNPVTRSAFWVDPRGLIVASSLRTYIGFDVSDRSFYREIVAGRDWGVSELIVGKATGKPAFTISRGIRSEQGKLLGIVAASIEPDRLDSVLGVERLKDAGVSLIDNKGMHVYRYPITEYTWEQRNWLRLYPVLEHVLKGEEKAISHISKLTGEKRLVAFVPIPSLGWVAAASRAEDEVMKAVASTLLFQAVLVLFVTLAGFGAAAALARPITNSIIGLRNHAVALGRGDLENLAPASGPEELKDLAVAFNQMAGEVRLREAALRESENRLRRFYESGLLGVIYWNMNGEITDANGKFLEMVGYDRDDLAAGRIDWGHMTPPEYRHLDENSAEELKATGVNKKPFEKEYLRKDGTRIPVIVAGAMLDEARFNGVAFVLDISERKQAEEALRKSEVRYRTLFDSMTEGFALHEILTDERGRPSDYRFLDVNPAFARLTGLKRADLLGKRVLEVLPGTETHWIENYGKVALTGEPMHFENFSAALKRWYEVFAYRPGPGQFAVVFTDITVRKEAEETLQRRTLELQRLTETLEERVRERTAELAALSSRLVSAQENERRRVSYDLHDNVWQSLDIIKSEIEHLFSGKDGPDWAAIQQRSREIIPLIRNTVATIRSMQGDLWPYVLEDIGIAATLEWYSREFMANQPSLSVEKHVDLDRKRGACSVKDCDLQGDAGGIEQCEETQPGEPCHSPPHEERPPVGI